MRVIWDAISRCLKRADSRPLCALGLGLVLLALVTERHPALLAMLAGYLLFAWWQFTAFRGWPPVQVFMKDGLYVGAWSSVLVIATTDVPPIGPALTGFLCFAMWLALSVDQVLGEQR